MNKHQREWGKFQKRLVLVIQFGKLINTGLNQRKRSIHTLIFYKTFQENGKRHSESFFFSSTSTFAWIHIVHATDHSDRHQVDQSEILVPYGHFDGMASEEWQRKSSKPFDLYSTNETNSSNN